MNGPRVVFNWTISARDGRALWTASYDTRSVSECGIWETKEGAHRDLLRKLNGNSRKAAEKVDPLAPELVDYPGRVISEHNQSVDSLLAEGWTYFADEFRKDCGGIWMVIGWGFGRNDRFVFYPSIIVPGSEAFCLSEKGGPYKTLGKAKERVDYVMSLFQSCPCFGNTQRR